MVTGWSSGTAGLWPNITRSSGLTRPKRWLRSITGQMNASPRGALRHDGRGQSVGHRPEQTVRSAAPSSCPSDMGRGPDRRVNAPRVRAPSGPEKTVYDLCDDRIRVESLVHPPNRHWPGLAASADPAGRSTDP